MKEEICHFFTIFGHRAVQRESFVYAAKNKMLQGSLGQKQSHSAIKLNLMVVYNNYTWVCGLGMQMDYHHSKILSGNTRTS